MHSIGKIAVVGSGAIGGYYGGKLAVSGQDVHFLMRSDLEAVRRDGLILQGQSGETHLRRVQVYGSTAEIGPSDLVLIALKSTSNHALRDLIPPLLHEGTLLLTLQNGLGNEDFLANEFGGDRVLGGLCFVCLNRVGPGVVEHYGHGTLSIGDFRASAKDRLRPIVTAFSEAGIETVAVENLLTERWRKLVWNIPFNGLSIAAGGVTVDEIMNDEGLRTLATHLMEEVIAAAGRLGHVISPDFVTEQMEKTAPMGPYKPSSLIDYLAQRAVEVEAIWGEPWRQATAAGASVGRLEALYFLLKKLTAACQ